MVTQQILVLSFWVRVPIAQLPGEENEDTSFSSLSFAGHIVALARKADEVRFLV